MVHRVVVGSTAQSGGTTTDPARNLQEIPAQATGTRRINTPEAHHSSHLPRTHPADCKRSSRSSGTPERILRSTSTHCGYFFRPTPALARCQGTSRLASRP
eukprot:jgi/Tetstr1/428359/TSEL_018394.t1